MNSYTPGSEFRHLVDRLLDEGTLSRTEMARIEEFCDDPNALAYFVSATSQEGMMPEALARTLQKTRREHKVVSFPFLTVLKFAAACFVAFFLGWQTRRPSASEKAEAESAPAALRPTEDVATITDADAAAEKSGLRIGQPLQKGTLTIPEGAKIGMAMRSGARLEVRGPADLLIEGAGIVRLRKGRLSTYAPEYAHGFTVDSDDGKVVDLGTRFVTATSAGFGTEIHVIEGKVQAFSLKSNALPWDLVSQQAGVLKDGKLLPIDYLEQRLNVALDPVLSDEDGDGIPDVQETFYGSDPRDAKSEPALLRVEESFSGYPEQSLANATSPRGAADKTPWSGYGTFVAQGLSYRAAGKSLKTSGGAIRTLGEGDKGAILIPAARELSPPGTLYISFLSQQPSAVGRGVFAGLLLYNGEREELFVGKVRPEFSYGSRLKLSPKYGGFSFPPDTATHLFVIRIDRNHLTTDVFIDPALGKPESASVRRVRYYDVPDFDRISLRSGADKAAFPVVFDELRVGLTWDSVLPLDR